MPQEWKGPKPWEPPSEEIAGKDGQVRVNFLNLAGFLVFKGHQLISFEWKDKKVCYCFFTKTEELKADISSYEQGQALVDPKSYNKSMASFRRVLYADPDSPYQAREEDSRG